VAYIQEHPQTGHAEAKRGSDNWRICW
jgi:hypothetical protein